MKAEEQSQHIQQQQQHQQHPQQQNQPQDEEDIHDEKWKKILQPQKKIDLFMIDFNQCDSKKCTGKKMERFKLITNLSDKKKKFKGIVLSAFGKKFISSEDAECCQKYGICVIDCSWNRVEQTKEFRYKHERKLPFVVAGNPVNYGKPYQLSCVEALATALCAINYIDQAEFIMSKFGWADGFWSQNKLIIEYGKCKTMEQIEKQSKINEESQTKTFQRNYDMPDSDSQSDN